MTFFLNFVEQMESKINSAMSVFVLGKWILHFFKQIQPFGGQAQATPLLGGILFDTFTGVLKEHEIIMEARDKL